MMSSLLLSDLNRRRDAALQQAIALMPREHLADCNSIEVPLYGDSGLGEPGLECDCGLSNRIKWLRDQGEIEEGTK